MVGCIKTTPGLPSLIFISWSNPFARLLRRASRQRPMAAGKIFLTYFALLPWTSSTAQHPPRIQFVHKRRKGTVRKIGTPDSRIEQSNVEGQERKVNKSVLTSLLITTKFLSANFLSPNSVRFTSQSHVYLPSSYQTLQKIQFLELDGDPILALIKDISLTGKWVPTPSASHDCVTNIATAISQLI